MRLTYTGGTTTVLGAGRGDRTRERRATIILGEGGGVVSSTLHYQKGIKYPGGGPDNKSQSQSQPGGLY